MWKTSLLEIDGYLRSLKTEKKIEIQNGKKSAPETCKVLHQSLSRRNKIAMIRKSEKEINLETKLGTFRDAT